MNLLAYYRSLEKYLKEKLMKFHETEIKDCWIIEWDVHVDERGHFGVSFNHHEFVFRTKIDTKFIQDNESFSHKNVIRGLHYQTGGFEQAKLVRCPVGQVIDVIYDMRTDSQHTIKL